MDWYVVNKKYINYLTQFDSRVGYVEYGERLKLHVGILLTIGDFCKTETSEDVQQSGFPQTPG